jgi:hypothetical protein
MKKIILRNFIRIFIGLVITAAVLLSTGTLKADPDPENYIVVRDCANGICIVYVYTQDLTLVNIYEELD